MKKLLPHICIDTAVIFLVLWVLDRINEERGYAAKIGRRDNVPNSDHYYLSQYCPAIFIYTLGGPYGGYHSPTDTCEGCGLGNYPRFLTLIRTFLEAL